MRSRTLASIGIVLLRSAMPCARRKPRRNSCHELFGERDSRTSGDYTPACDRPRATNSVSELRARSQPIARTTAPHLDFLLFVIGRPANKELLGTPVPRGPFLS